MSDLVTLLADAKFTESNWQTPEFKSYLRQRVNGYVDVVRLSNPGYEREIEVCTWMTPDELKEFLVHLLKQSQ